MAGDHRDRRRDPRRPRRGRGPAAAARARVRHRRPLAVARRSPPRPDAHGARRRAGMTAEQQAAARRARARRARRASATAVARRAPPPDARRPAAHRGVRRRRRRHGRVPAVARGGARAARATTAAAPQWHKADVAPDADFRVVGDRCGHVGPARRAPAAAGRHRLRHPREERRRRRHLVREQLSRLPGRQPEPHLQLLVRAAPRLAAPLLDPGRAARLLPRLRRRVRRARPTSGSGPRCVSATWYDDDRRWTVRRPRRRRRPRTRSIANAVVSAVGQLNRPRFPDIHGRDTFAGPSFHSARWDHDASTSTASASP